MRVIVALIILYILPMAHAYDTPRAWPWRGVSIENIDFNPANFIEELNGVNIKSVQLRLRPRMLVERAGITPELAWQQSLDWAEAMLDQCKENRVSAILNVEGFPLDPAAGYNQTSPTFWFDSQDLKDVVQLASDLSKKFATRGAELVAYQIMSEPVMLVGGSAFSPPQLNGFINDIIQAIRKNDADRWIAVAPMIWGTQSGYDSYVPLRDERIVYSAHMYSPHPFTHQGVNQYTEKYSYPGLILNDVIWDMEKLRNSLAGLRNFEVKYEVPVWIGEFSAIRWASGAEKYIADLVSIFDEYNWSWTYYSLNGWNGWNPNYNNVKPVLYDDWKSQEVGDKSRRWETLKTLFK